MGLSVNDVVPFTQARANLSQLAERERIHLLLIEDAKRGLEDIAAGRTEDAVSAIARLQQGRVEK